MPDEAFTKSKTILRRRSRTNRISRALIRWPHGHLAACARSPHSRNSVELRLCRLRGFAATRCWHSDGILPARVYAACRDSGHCGIGRAYADASVHCNRGHVEPGCATHLRRSQVSIYRFATSTYSLARRTRVYPAHAGCGLQVPEATHRRLCQGPGRQKIMHCWRQCLSVSLIFARLQALAHTKSVDL